MSEHIDVGKIERKRERKRRNVCKICVSLIRIKRERENCRARSEHRAVGR